MTIQFEILILIFFLLGARSLAGNMSMLVEHIHQSTEGQLVYDFADRMPRLSLMIIPLLFVAIGIAVYIYNKKYADTHETMGLGINKRQYGMAFGIVFASFAGLISIILIPAMLTDYFKTKSVYDNLQYQIIEGVVENYRPMPPGGHDNERFTVNGIEFEFSDFDVSDYGYNNAASLGGAIKEGLKVRIGYFRNGYKNIILKLEIF